VSVLAHAIRRVLGGRGTGVLDDAGDEALCYVERFSEPGHFGPGRAGFFLLYVQRNVGRTERMECFAEKSCWLALSFSCRLEADSAS
jgi:hypothetical protein